MNALALPLLSTVYAGAAPFAVKPHIWTVMVDEYVTNYAAAQIIPFNAGRSPYRLLLNFVPAPLPPAVWDGMGCPSMETMTRFRHPTPPH